VKKTFSWLIFALVAVYGSAYLFHHFPLTTQAQSPEQSQAAAPQPPEAAEANKVVTFAGPLADYAQNESTAKSNPPATGLGKPDASDLIVDSPAGTGGVVLHKTFSVATTARFLFEIPAHATNPQLRGTYKSFLSQGGDASADNDANVEFLLMNRQQCTDFLKGRRADVVYFVESSHSQQVDIELAPTYDKAAPYCLVFRNRTAGTPKKVVQADFSVDY
jgi:hypothetical protein